MKNLNKLLIFIALILPIKLFSQDAKKIVEEAINSYENTPHSAILSITTIKGKNVKNYKLKYATDGENSLTVVLEPEKEKGISYLFKNQEIYLFNPKVNKIIKLGKGLIGQNWLGTDLSNQDLFYQKSFLEYYDLKILAEEKVGNNECWKILALAKDENASWYKILLWIEKKDFIILKQEYYDEDNFKIRTILSEQIKQFDGRKIPTQITVIPENKKMQKTILKIDKINFKANFSEDFFNTKNLKNALNLDFKI